MSTFNQALAIARDNKMVCYELPFLEIYKLGEVSNSFVWEYPGTSDIQIYEFYVDTLFYVGFVAKSYTAYFILNTGEDFFEKLYQKICEINWLRGH